MVTKEEIERCLGKSVKFKIKNGEEFISINVKEVTDDTALFRLKDRTINYDCYFFIEEIEEITPLV